MLSPAWISVFGVRQGMQQGAGVQDQALLGAAGLAVAGGCWSSGRSC